MSTECKENHNIKSVHNFFSIVAMFKYLVIRIINLKYIHTIFVQRGIRVVMIMNFLRDMSKYKLEVNTSYGFAL